MLICVLAQMTFLFVLSNLVVFDYVKLLAENFSKITYFVPSGTLKLNSKTDLLLLLLLFCIPQVV